MALRFSARCERTLLAFRELCLLLLWTPAQHQHQHHDDAMQGVLCILVVFLCVLILLRFVFLIFFVSSHVDVVLFEQQNALANIISIPSAVLVR